MQVINKRIIVIFICVSIFIFGLFKLFNKKEIELDNVILDINNSKDSLAIYIEEYDAEGNASYVESKYSTFPIEDYVYNKTLSGCLDSNSNEVENALNYNYVDKELNLRVNKPVTCYVYYDYKGDGTETIPYKIRSIEDLLDLSKAVNSGETYTGKYFELTRDLDFSDKNSYNDSERTDYGNLNGIEDNNTLINEMTTGTGWIPIGNSGANNFHGIFNGTNKKIKNLYINIETQQEQLGLFGYTSNSIIKNLNLYGNINTKLKSDTGALIGRAINTNIENVNNYVNITSMVGSYALGGIIGSVFSGNAIVKNCVNYGNITNGNNTGGLVGYNGGSLTIENSHNEGIVTNSLVGKHAGGLLGRDNASTNTTTILNSYNNGEVIIDGNDREAFSGGLVGKLNGNVYINNSYNKGKINANIDASVLVVYSGGLIGCCSGKTIMTNSHNNANVTGGNRIGGLVGLIGYSYNTGNLSPSKNSNNSSEIYVGGISSQAWNGAQIYAFNSYNTGDVETNSLLKKGYGGGVISLMAGNTKKNQKVSIVNSYNIGNILNGNTGVGFSLLDTGTMKLDNVYNLGDFKDVTTKYGISKFTGQDYDVKNAYYRNKAEDGSAITGSNITSEEIIGKDLSYMQSEAFVTELNNNLSSINISDYIDNDLLTEFETTTGYKLTLSKWLLKDGHPVLADLEGM